MVLDREKIEGGCWIERRKSDFPCLRPRSDYAILIRSYMPRKPDIDRPTDLHLMLPESIRAKLDLLLFSEVEGRVPHGEYQRFIVGLIREFFARGQKV